MKIFKTTLAVTLVAGLAGCTYSGPPEDPGATASVATTSGSSPARQPDQAQVLAGEFVSQAAMTRGTVALTVTPLKVELELAEFSTGEGDDLYVHLNPGTLEPSATGEIALNSTEYFVVAPLKAQMGTQYYDLTAEWPSLPRIRSVTIYRYSSDVQEAYGTANLAER
ncbi:MAG TPA: DM13 domain-containing protein [Arthrobacter sp.]